MRRGQFATAQRGRSVREVGSRGPFDRQSEREKGGRERERLERERERAS